MNLQEAIVSHNRKYGFPDPQHEEVRHNLVAQGFVTGIIEQLFSEYENTKKEIKSIVFVADDCKGFVDCRFEPFLREVGVKTIDLPQGINMQDICDALRFKKFKQYGYTFTYTV